MVPAPFDWKAWINCNPPLKTISHAMTTTTPNDVARGNKIARKPKTMSSNVHTIDVPEPRLGSFDCAIIRFLLAVRRFADGPNRVYNTAALELLYQPNAPSSGYSHPPKWRH